MVEEVPEYGLLLLLGTVVKELERSVVAEMTPIVVQNGLRKTEPVEEVQMVILEHGGMGLFLMMSIWFNFVK